MRRVRIFLTGVGGQGTLTATRLLAQTVMDSGAPVTSGEIHGMAQRGGVVESTVLAGGFLSPKISPGEADVLLGFDLLETLRALPMLRRGGVVVANSEAVPPLSVALGRERYPSLEEVREKTLACAGTALFLPCRTLAQKAGTAQSENTVLLGAATALGVFPFDAGALKQAVKAHLSPKIVEVNLRALALGVEAAGEVRTGQ